MSGLAQPRANTRFRNRLQPLALGASLGSASFAVATALHSAANPLKTDFAAAYVQGKVIWLYGPASAYDATLLERVRESVHPALWFRFEYPPLQALALNAPLAWLPLSVASWLWTGVLALVTVALWWLLAGHLRGWLRWLSLLLLLSLPPLWLILGFQAVDLFIPLGVAASWRLLGAGHARAAGAVLVLAMIKPQLIFMLLPVLLAARLWTVALSWLMTSIGVGLITFLAVGWQGTSAWFTNLEDGYLHPSAYLVDPGGGLATIFPAGSVARIVFAAAVLAAAVAVGIRWRTRSPGALYAAGAIASVVASPFLHRPDLVMIPVAAWILLIGTRWSLRGAAAAVALVAAFVTAIPIGGTLAGAAGLLILGALAVWPKEAAQTAAPDASARAAALVPGLQS